MKCPHCDYEWESRKKEPKACPRCKRRLDYPIKKEKKDELSKAKDIERGFKRTVYVMSILTERLEEEGIMPVIVGGAAVEFYTRDWYATADIDLVINKDKREEFYEVMEGFGFEKEGRMWIREDMNLYIEIPADLSDLSKDRLTEVETEDGHVYIIGLEEIIFDRIQAAEHWESESDREQAVRIGAAFYNEIDWDYVRSRCEEEKSTDMLEEVLKVIEDEENQA